MFYIFGWFCQIEVCEIALNNGCKCCLILNWKFFCFGFCFLKTSESSYDLIWGVLLLYLKLLVLFQMFMNDSMGIIRICQVFFLKIVYFFVVAKFGLMIYGLIEAYSWEDIFLWFDIAQNEDWCVCCTHMADWPRNQVIWLLF